MKRLPLIFLAICLGAASVPVWAESGAPADALLEDAEKQAGQGDHSAAAESLARAGKLAPEQESIQYRQATQLVFLLKFDQAKEIFSRLTQSSNPQLAGMARNSLSALHDEQTRVADYEARADRMRLTTAAQQAAMRAKERELRHREADLQTRQEIYDLFAAGETGLGLDRFTAYVKGNTAPIDLRYAAIYALQRERRATEAAAALEALPAEEHSTAEWLLARGRTLRALGRGREAWRDFDTARQVGEGTPLALEADAEIRALPSEANLNRWAWGELQLDAVHLFRFDDTIFYGQVREGTFVPGARWIQPFVQADFTLDTKSGAADGVSQVYSNNLAGVHAGVRIRPFAREAIWLYGTIGMQKDLRGTTRFEGSWFLDWRVGVRAYKGYGPGLTFATAPDFGQVWMGPLDVHHRAAWFVEGGLNAAYYSLYENFIAYYEARAGFRVLEIGSRVGFDLYALQQGTLDSRGLYYNNFIETGVGVRAIARLQPGVALITRVEAIGGAYLGRDAENSRGSLGSSYGDARVTVSLWAEW